MDVASLDEVNATLLDIATQSLAEIKTILHQPQSEAGIGASDHIPLLNSMVHHLKAPLAQISASLQFPTSNNNYYQSCFALAAKMRFINDLVLTVLNIELEQPRDHVMNVSLLAWLQKANIYDKSVCLQISGEGVLTSIRSCGYDLLQAISIICWVLAKPGINNHIWVDSSSLSHHIVLTLWNTAVTFPQNSIAAFKKIVTSGSLFNTPEINDVALPLAVAQNIVSQNNGHFYIDPYPPGKIEIVLPVY